MIDSRKTVPLVVIKRLPRYYRYLSDLLKSDVKRISSGELSKKMHVTASQIRQDFNHFGGFGQHGYGYNVEYLHKTIAEILGVDKCKTTIVIGAGNLGKAIANHDSFEKRGFKITALFDTDPNVFGKNVNGKPVLDISELEKYILENKVDIAILTVPKTCVQELATRVVKAGVKGIMNFSYAEISADGDVAVENIHLSDSLMTLSFKLKHEIYT